MNLLPGGCYYPSKRGLYDDIQRERRVLFKVDKA
jgi:hypothetical protein